MRGSWPAGAMLCLSLLLPARSDSPPAVAGAAAQWHQWRGPTGQGYSDDTRVPLTWGETENLLWKTPLPGKGNSTPVVWGDRIFLTASSPDGRERYLLCVGATDGKVLWKQLAARDENPLKTHDWNGHASASCTTDGERVYAFFGTPGLFCFDIHGKLLWHHQFGIFTSETGWGVAASPFLFDDLVIQNCDTDGPKYLPRGRKAEEAAPADLVALDKRTGEERWRAPRDQGRGFSTPVLVKTPQGRMDLVLNGPHGVWGYDPRSGNVLWHSRRSDPGDSHRFGEPLPVFNGEFLYVASGRPGPSQAIRLGGKGDVGGSQLLWQVVRKGHRDVGSPLLWDGLIYLTDRDGRLAPQDVRTGQVVYSERLSGSKVNSMASPVLVRGKLLFLMDEGTTVVVEPGRTFKAVGRNKLGDSQPLDFGASPAIADGRLYLRSQSHLYCIGEKR